ncbi:hypothetical protein DIPPA_16685 [Diplonema papillatum]|nr:hypothetical protein DIPPA_16685 [Diplonema papillatum]
MSVAGEPFTDGFKRCFLRPFVERYTVADAFCERRRTSVTGEPFTDGFKRRFLRPSVERYVSVVFWFVFVAFFQKPDLPHCSAALSRETAAQFAMLWEMFHADGEPFSPSKRSARQFLELYDVAVAQVVTLAHVEAFKGNAVMFSASWANRVYLLVLHLMTGVRHVESTMAAVRHHHFANTRASLRAAADAPAPNAEPNLESSFLSTPSHLPAALPSNSDIVSCLPPQVAYEVGAYLPQGSIIDGKRATDVVIDTMQKNCNFDIRRERFKFGAFPIDINVGLFEAEFSIFNTRVLDYSYAIAHRSKAHSNDDTTRARPSRGEECPEFEEEDAEPAAPTPTRQPFNRLLNKQLRVQTALLRDEPTAVRALRRHPLREDLMPASNVHERQGAPGHGTKIFQPASSPSPADPRLKAPAAHAPRGLFHPQEIAASPRRSPNPGGSVSTVPPVVPGSKQAGRSAAAAGGQPGRNPGAKAGGAACPLPAGRFYETDDDARRHRVLVERAAVMGGEVSPRFDPVALDMARASFRGALRRYDFARANADEAAHHHQPPPEPARAQACFQPRLLASLKHWGHAAASRAAAAPCVVATAALAAACISSALYKLVFDTAGDVPESERLNVAGALSHAGCCPPPAARQPPPDASVCELSFSTDGFATAAADAIVSAVASGPRGRRPTTPTPRLSSQMAAAACHVQTATTTPTPTTGTVVSSSGKRAGRPLAHASPVGQTKCKRGGHGVISAPAVFYEVTPVVEGVLGKPREMRVLKRWLTRTVLSGHSAENGSDRARKIMAGHSLADARVRSIIERDRTSFLRAQNALEQDADRIDKALGQAHADSALRSRFCDELALENSKKGSANFRSHDAFATPNLVHAAASTARALERAFCRIDRKFASSKT